MKTVLTVIVLCALGALVLTLFNKCSKKDDKPSPLGAVVEVTVKNWPGGKPSNVTVYMYKDVKITDDIKTSDAKKQVVTDENGVALFDLNFTELNILESQTSLYFAVFYKIGDKDFVAGSIGVTVNRNDSKKLELVIPL